jgi:hypothetical protein
MVVLRPTRKLRTALPVTEVTGTSDTALGDWYVNRIVVDRQPLLLLVSSASLLAMLVPARDVRGLPERLADIVANRLARPGVATSRIEAE